MAKERTIREKPKYGENTFKTKKAKELINYILSREGWVIEIEGGKRGSKDVLGIYGWSQFLMLTPDREHLVLGRTLEHAIVTVLHSQGYGLMYTIPSGEFTRESVSGGATRGVFKFYDAYGVEKIIYFYGNEKAQDYAKFKGFSLGSVYINEGNEQHVTGLREAKERTNASRWPRVIITQNPKGGAHTFYRDLEAPLIYTPQENMLIEEIRARFSEDFNTIKDKMIAEMNVERKRLVSQFLSRRGVRKAEMLPKKDYNLLLSQVRDLKEAWNKKIRGVQVSKITNDYSDPNNKSYAKMASASMQLIMNYVPYFDNPNKITNGLEFAYFHFTHDDNPSMTGADRARVDRTYDTSSPTYKRDIRGLRATVDNAIFPTFTEANVYDYNVPETHIKARVFGVDVGYDHPFGALEGLILHDNTLMIDNELFIIPEQEREKANNVEYIQRLKAFIEAQYNGEYIGIRVDPSAKGFINQALSEGLLAIKAKNRVRNYKPDEAMQSDHNEDRKMVGINLVREGFRLNRIMIRRRCTNLIKEIQGYHFDPKKLELGVEVPVKIHDDLVDPLRYIVNSEIGYVHKWKEGGEITDVKERQETILGQQIQQESNEDKVDIQQRLTKSIIQEFKNNSGYLF